MTGGGARLAIRPYTPGLRPEWDALAAASPGATFLFDRGYMDYHAHRFTDASFVFVDAAKGDSLVAAVAGCGLDGGARWVSHAGLTYGGLFCRPGLHAQQAIECMELLDAELAERGVQTAVYKALPHIYTRYADEAPLYALTQRLGASLCGRDLASALPADAAGRLPVAQLRRRGAARAAKAGVTVTAGHDAAALERFWPVLEANLKEKYAVAPVHTLQEILLLQGRFPERIRAIEARAADGECLGGTVLYLTDACVHVQYISASAQGKACGALDLLFCSLLGPQGIDGLTLPGGTCWIDFGRSTEDDGRVLNAGLLSQKEGFGARGVCYDTYSWTPGQGRR